MHKTDIVDGRIFFLLYDLSSERESFEKKRRKTQAASMFLACFTWERSKGSQMLARRTSCKCNSISKNVRPKLV